eukprot:scaffold24983_cov107-Isochrysis_galbana.AAC.2
MQAPGPKAEGQQLCSEPPPPPRGAAGARTGQGGSVFLAIGPVAPRPSVFNRGAVPPDPGLVPGGGGSRCPAA